MSHYLSTENPIAAAELSGQIQPLPSVGDTVLYRPRRSEVKRGRMVMPAMVIWANEDSRTLELFVIADANDQINQEKVPESPCEGEWGWVRKPPDSDEVAALRSDLDLLKQQVWGECEIPDGGLTDVVFELEGRLAKVEKLAAKPKPGRPKNTKNKPKSVPATPVADAA